MNKQRCHGPHGALRPIAYAGMCLHAGSDLVLALQYGRWMPGTAGVMVIRDCKTRCVCCHGLCRRKDSSLGGTKDDLRTAMGQGAASEKRAQCTRRIAGL